jgi:hypothetical protein
MPITQKVTPQSHSTKNKDSLLCKSIPRSMIPSGWRNAFDTSPPILRQKTKVESANRVIISQIMRIFGQ